jgi:hypothetical protein
MFFQRKSRIDLELARLQSERDAAQRALELERQRRAVEQARLDNIRAKQDERARLLAEIAYLKDSVRRSRDPSYQANRVANRLATKVGDPPMNRNGAIPPPEPDHWINPIFANKPKSLPVWSSRGRGQVKNRKVFGRWYDCLASACVDNNFRPHDGDGWLDIFGDDWEGIILKLIQERRRRLGELR